MTEKKAGAKKPDANWKGIEREYRAGIRSLKAIGEEFGVSDAGILKRAKRDGWERDLGAKIRAKAEALVSADVVSEEVSAANRIEEREIIQANAEVTATVIRGQRKVIGELWELAKSLMAELTATTDNLELFDQVGELCLTSDKDGIDKLNELYRKVMSLPQRTDTMKKLTEVIKMIVELERKVFKLDDGADPAEAAARGAAQGAASAVAALQMDFSDVKDQFK